MLQLDWIFTLVLGHVVTSVIGEGLAPQSFRVKPKNVTVKTGDDVILPCEIDHLAGRVQWVKDGFSLGESPYDTVHLTYPRYDIMVERGGVFNLKIVNVSIVDDAEFQCQVSPKPPIDAAIRAFAKVTVIVPPSEIKMLRHANNSKIGVKESETLKLDCLASRSVPPAKIIWYRDGKLLKNSNQTEITANCGDRKTDAPGCEVLNSLTLRVTLADEAVTYACLAKHEALTAGSPPSLMTKVTLTVLHPPGAPYIEGYAEETSLEIGQRVELFCKSKGGQPVPQLIWYKNADLLQANCKTHGKITENSISFLANESDNGAVYKCEASSPALDNPMTNSVKLSVYYGPSEMSISGDVEARTLEKVSVKCSTSSSNPAAQIKWEVEGESANGTHSKQWASGENGGFLTESTLRFPIPANKRGSVRVVCYGINPKLARNAVANHTINVVYPPGQPIISGYVPGSFIMAGSIQRISCMATGGNPLASLSWFKNDKRITSVTKKAQLAASIAEIAVLANVTDNGAIYKCEANSPAIDTPLIETVKLNVYFAPNNATIDVSPKIIRCGNLARITCNCTSSNPAAELAWFANGIPISEGFTSYTAPGLHGGRLTYGTLLLNATADMNGAVITCQATNAVLERSSNVAVELVVLYKPKFSELLQTTFVGIEGKSFAMVLEAEANPVDITYEWTKDGKPLTRGVDAGGLHIKKVDKSMTGYYSCEARNTEGSQFIGFQFIVHYYATVINITKTVTNSEGSKVSLWCVVDGLPLESIHVYWITPSKTSIPSSSFENHTATLNIINFQASDAGAYWCVADNHLGKTDKKSTKLLLEHKPIVDLKGNNRKLAKNLHETALLTCRAFGPPEVTFHWSKPDGSAVQVSEEKYSVENGALLAEEFCYESRLKIYNVVHADYGSYECVASNKYGSAQVRFDLSVVSKPDPPEGLEIFNVTKDGASATWHLEFDGGSTTNFKIRYRSSDSKFYKTEDVGGITSHRLNGLKPAITYILDVAASNALGQSEFSQPVNFTTAAEEVANEAINTTKSRPTLVLKNLLDSDGTLLLFVAVITIILLFVNALFLVSCAWRRSRKYKRKNEMSMGGRKSASLELFGDGITFSPKPANFKRDDCERKSAEDVAIPKKRDRRHSHYDFRERTSVKYGYAGGSAELLNCSFKCSEGRTRSIPLCLSGNSQNNQTLPSFGSNGQSTYQRGESPPLPPDDEDESGRRRFNHRFSQEDVVVATAVDHDVVWKTLPRFRPVPTPPPPPRPTVFPGYVDRPGGFSESPLFMAPPPPMNAITPRHFRPESYLLL